MLGSAVDRHAVESIKSGNWSNTYYNTTSTFVLVHDIDSSVNCMRESKLIIFRLLFELNENWYEVNYQVYIDSQLIVIFSKNTGICNNEVNEIKF